MALPSNLRYQFRHLQIAEYLHDLFVDNSCGHDFWHLYRVCETAALIGIRENLDWRQTKQIEILALIHDVFDNKIHFAVPREEVIENLKKLIAPELSVLQCTFEDLERSATSLRWSNDGSEATMVEKVVMDADRLDAIGAIGIIRAASFGGANNLHMYDAEAPETDYKSGSASSSTITHFFEKLQYVKDRLFTYTAQEIGNERHLFMMDEFMPEFMYEIHHQISDRVEQSIPRAGTMIRFTKTLEEGPDDYAPSYHFCYEGEIGEIVGRNDFWGFIAKTANHPGEFGVKLGEFEVLNNFHCEPRKPSEQVMALYNLACNRAMEIAILKRENEELRRRLLDVTRETEAALVVTKM